MANYPTRISSTQQARINFQVSAKLKTPMVLVLSCMILNFYSCTSDQPPEDSLGKDALTEIIASESGGKILVNSFSKTNGLRREVNGLANYTMEFKSQIQFDETSTNLWQPLGDKKKFYKDAIADIEGEINFEKTEKGWRKSNYKIIKTSISNNINPLDKLIGLWAEETPTPDQASFRISRLNNSQTDYLIELNFSGNTENFYGTESNNGIKFHYIGMFISYYGGVDVLLQPTGDNKLIWSDESGKTTYKKSVHTNNSTEESTQIDKFIGSWIDADNSLSEFKISKEKNSYVIIFMYTEGEPYYATKTGNKLSFDYHGPMTIEMLNDNKVILIDKNGKNIHKRK